MAAKKKHVKVVGLRDALTVGDLTVDRTGTEVTQKQLDELREVAAAHRVLLEVSETDDSGDESASTTNTTSGTSSAQTGGS